MWGGWRRKLCPSAKSSFSLVLSNLEYASHVWDPFLQSDISNLQRIQRRAARFVQGRERWSPIATSPHPTVSLPELSWDSLNHRRKLVRLSLLYKTLNGAGAVALPTDKLIKQDSRTRGGKTILSTSGGTSHPFFPRTIVDWNELPEKTEEAASISIFKRCSAHKIHMRAHPPPLLPRTRYRYRCSNSVARMKM